MTDDLRTRIARVLYRNFGGPFWDDETDDAREMWCCDADRLIRELKLHVVTVGYFQTVIKGSYPTPLEDM